MSATTNNVVPTLLSNSAAQHVEATNQGFEDVDKAVRGQLTKAIADGTTALTSTEAQYRFIKLTGTLTAAATVTIPNIAGMSRPFTVWNATTGGFDITFKTVSGTGVEVKNNTSNQLWVDTSGNAQGSSSSSSTIGSVVTGYATADQNVTSSTTLTDSTYIKFAMAESGIYKFKCFLFTGTGNNSSINFKFAVNGPTGLVKVAARWKDSSTNTAGDITAYNSAVNLDYGANDSSVLEIEGIVENGTTAGNFVFRFAQENSSATATTTKRGSSVVAHKLN